MELALPRSSIVFPVPLIVLSLSYLIDFCSLYWPPRNIKRAVLCFCDLLLEGFICCLISAFDPISVFPLVCLFHRTAPVLVNCDQVQCISPVYCNFTFLHFTFCDSSCIFHSPGDPVGVHMESTYRHGVLLESTCSPSTPGPVHP